MRFSWLNLESDDDEAILFVGGGCRCGLWTCHHRRVGFEDCRRWNDNECGQVLQVRKNVGANGYTIKLVYSAKRANTGTLIAVGQSECLSDRYTGEALKSTQWWSNTYFSAMQNGALGVAVGNTSAAGYGDYDATMGAISVVFTVKWPSLTANNVNVVVYCNGDKVAELTSSQFNRYTNGIFVSSEANLIEAQMYDALLTDEEAIALSLPEPTVLALLALGVAGVALRRKVA